MIIKEIHIDGFGIFHAYSLASLTKGVNIIVGNNEAGKSTLLKFLRYTLFGYPRTVNERMAPLAGGNHGGRIHAVLSSGKEAIFERNGINKQTLFYQQQESSGNILWNELLGNASASLYNNIYAFTLDELVGLGSLTDSGVEDKIFSLSLGMGNVSVSDLENHVRTCTDDIFTTPRATSRRIPLILREMEEKYSQIRRIQDNLALYHQLTTDIEMLDAQTESAEQKLAALRKEFTLLDAYLRCYENFVLLSRAEEDLRQLPPLQQLPENGVQQLQKYLDAISELDNTIQHLEKGTAEEKGLPEIEYLLKGISVNIPLLEKKDTVEYIRLNLTGYQQTIAERASESARMKELDANILQTINGKINSQWSEYDVMAFGDIPLHTNRVEAYSLTSQRLRDEIRDWEAREKALMGHHSSFNMAGIATLVAAMLFIAAMPAFYYGIPVLGGAFLLAGIALFAGRKVFVKKDPLVPVRQKIKELQKEEQEYMDAWRKYLHQELKLSPDLPFHALPGIFQSIEHLQIIIAQRDRLRRQIQEERLPVIYDYEGKVKELQAFLEQPLTSTEIETLARAVTTEYDTAAEKQAQINGLREDLRRKRQEKQQKEASRKALEDAIGELLDSVGAACAEEFLHQYAENEKVARLTHIRNNALEKIETVAGLHKAGEVTAYLASHDKQFVEERLAALKSDIEEQDRQTKALHTQKGAIEKEKERIAGESDLAERLTELETERQKLRDAYKEWVSGQVALRVLTRVKASYEKDKQPAVVKSAGQYFQTITQGQYTGIRASLEGREMSILDHRQASKNIDQLSRGTKEQLLVSLRLGFIDEYETRAEALPIILDEILVNFDLQRGRKTAQIMQDFAQNRQLLLFTCHPSTLSLFDREKVNVIEMG